MNFNPSSYPKLKEAIEKNNLVLFSGAGTSINLINTHDDTLGNWNELVGKIIAHLAERGHDVRHLENALRVDPAIKVLEFLEDFSRDIDKNEIYEFIDKHLILDESKCDFSLHKLLHQLSSKIITTNYDKAFEIANPSLVDSNRIIIRGNSAKIERLKHEDEYLLKIHGCYTHENSMVLFKSDYENLYNTDGNIDSKHLLTFLTNLFYNKTILFIGYAMGDAEINLILKNIKKVTNEYSPKHFIITKDKLDEDLKSFLIPIPIDSFADLPDYIKSLVEIKNTQNKEKNKDFDLLKSELEKTNDTISFLVEVLFSDAMELHNQKKYESAIKKFNQICKAGDFAIVYNNLGSTQNELAHTLEGESQINMFNDCFASYAKSIDLNPANADAYYNLGIALSDFAGYKDGDEQESLIKASIEKYLKAIELDPDSEKSYNSYNNLGIELYNLSKIRTGEEKEKLIHESLEQYSLSAALNPNSDYIYYNWGISLAGLGEITTDQDKKKAIFEEVIGKYEQSIKFNPNNCKTYNNLASAYLQLVDSDGIDDQEKNALMQSAVANFKLAIKLNPEYELALCNLADTLSYFSSFKTGEEKEKLLNDCLDQYEKIIKFNKTGERYIAWAHTLYNLAKTKKGKQQEALLSESIEKYKEASILEPSNESVYYNWGNAIIEQARNKTGSKQKQLFLEAERVLLTGVGLEGSTYNLACLYALSGRKNEALRFLEVSLKKGAISLDHIHEDEDWQHYRTDPDFMDLLSRHAK